jgi:hypothetical protein
MRPPVARTHGITRSASAVLSPSKLSAYPHIRELHWMSNEAVRDGTCAKFFCLLVRVQKGQRRA